MEFSVKYICYFIIYNFTNIIVCPAITFCVVWELWSQNQVNLNFAWQPVYICTVNREGICSSDAFVPHTYLISVPGTWNPKAPFTRAEHWAVSTGSIENGRHLTHVYSSQSSRSWQMPGFYRRGMTEKGLLLSIRWMFSANAWECWVMCSGGRSSRLLVQDLLPCSSVFFFLGWTRKNWLIAFCEWWLCWASNILWSVWRGEAASLHRIYLGPGRSQQSL